MAKAVTLENYIDEKYEFSAPQYFDFVAGETPEEAAEAERWFRTPKAYPPSPFVAKTRSLLESKDFSGSKDTYNEVEKLIARVSSEHGNSNISQSSGVIFANNALGAGDAKISSETREAMTASCTVATKQVDSNLSDPSKIVTKAGAALGSVSCESQTGSLTTTFSSEKKEQKFSSDKIEESASVSVDAISSRRTEENSSSANISIQQTEDPREVDNVPITTKVHAESVEGELSLTASSLVLGSLVKGQVRNEKIDQEATIDAGEFLSCASNEAMDKEATVGAVVACSSQKVNVEDLCTSKAMGNPEKSGTSAQLLPEPGKLLLKRDHSEVEKHEPWMRRHTHLKKTKRPLTRCQRSKTEMPAAGKIRTESQYANKRQKLEGGRSRQVCNSKGNNPQIKAVPTLTIPQEFHFQTEERFQTHRGAYCRSFSQAGSPVSPYVPLAERVLRFQFKAPERLHSRPENQSLKLTRPKEPDLVTSQRARPPRIKSSAELEEEMLVNMPKFKARPLNKKILEAPTLAALPRSMPQLPEFQEFNLKTAERALLHPNTSNKLASGSEAKFVPDSDKWSAMMNSRFSVPCGPYALTTLAKDKRIEVNEEKGRAKFSACSFEKKLMPYMRHEDASDLSKMGQRNTHPPVTSTENVFSMVAQNNVNQLPQIEEKVLQGNAHKLSNLKENMSHPSQLMSGPALGLQPVTKGLFKAEAQPLVSRENVIVPERTRRPLSEIQGAHAVPFGLNVNNFGPTLASWKEKVFQVQPSPVSVQDNLKESLQTPVVQMKNAFIAMQESRSLASASISRQMR